MSNMENKQKNLSYLKSQIEQRKKQGVSFQHIELPDVQQHLQEEDLLRAFVTSVPTETKQEVPLTKPPTTWERLTSWLPGYAFDLCAVGVFAYIILFAGPAPHMQIKLTQKGHKAHKPQHKSLLQVAVKSTSTKKVQRLKMKDSVKPSQQLLFGFYPSKSGGYFYLIKSSQLKRDELIYPFPGTQPQKFKSTQMHFIRHQGKLQEYALSREKGALRFLAMEFSKPLSNKEKACILLFSSWKNIPTKIDMLKNSCTPNHKTIQFDFLELDVRKQE